MIIRQLYLLSLLTAATAALFFAALYTGPADINMMQAFIDGINSTHSLPAILNEIRPRAILAVMVGATLGLAGAAMRFAPQPWPALG